MRQAQRFLLLCCLLSNVYDVSAFASKPKIQLIRSKDNFVEDKETTFTCHIQGSPTNAQVTWLIRDRTTLINTFLSSNFSRLQQTQPQKLAPGQKSIFSVVMRRDFTNMEVVCRSINCLEDFFRIPYVKKTNSIGAVRFGSRHQVRGQRLEVHCDVQDPQRVVRRMFFRVPTSFELAKENETLENDWIRFYLNSSSTYVATMKVYNGWPIQCFAVTKHEKQNIGNVMSPTTTLVVHYLEFSKATFRGSKTEVNNSDTTITLGQAVSFSLEVAAHPRPPKTQFFAVSADGRAGVERSWTSVERINVLDIARFEVLLDFAPKQSGAFKVLFESAQVRESGAPLFSNSSDSFSVNVFYPHFDNRSSHWHDKTFSRRKLFSDHFLLYTSPAPRSDQLQLLRLSEESPGMRLEVAEENFTKIVKMDGQENLYRVDLTVVDPESGTYVPVFRSGSLDVYGPQLRITVQSEEDKGHLALIAIICFVLLTVIVACFVYRRKRALWKLKRYVPVRIMPTNSLEFFDFRLSWSRNLIHEQIIDARIGPVVKVAANGAFVDSPDTSRPRHGDILTFLAPKSLRLYVVGVRSWQPIFEKTMELEPTDLTWGMVMDRVQRTVGEKYSIIENCTAFIFGRYYAPKLPDESNANTQHRLAIRIYENEEIFCRDERTLEEVPRKETKIHFWKFLTPSSSFRWPVGSPPVVELRIGSRHLLWCPEEGEEPSQAAPLLKDPEACFKPLLDEASPDVIAFLQLVTYELAENKIERFVRLTDGDYCRCNSEGAELFHDHDIVIKSQLHVPEDAWRRELLFLKAGEELPIWNVPRNKTVTLFVREGVTLEIEQRKIKVIKNEARHGESEWVAPVVADDFQNAFSDVIRTPEMMTAETIEYVDKQGRKMKIPIQAPNHG